MDVDTYLANQKNLKIGAYTIVFAIFTVALYCSKLFTQMPSETGMYLIVFTICSLIIFFLPFLNHLFLFLDAKHVGRALLSVNETKNETSIFEDIFIFEARAFTILCSSFVALYLFLFLGVVCNRYLVPCVHIISHSKYKQSNVYSDYGFG